MRKTHHQWLICAIAALGFAFDIYEILMAPLVVGPAIGELTGSKPGTPDFNFWVGMFFWVPALVGGAFGLLGGYLTDRFGRRRVLVWSILLYAFSALAAGFSTNIYDAARAALDDLHRRVRRVRGRGGVDRGALPGRRSSARRRSATRRRSRRSAACWSRARYYIAVTYGAVVPGDRRQPRAVALHADLRRHPGAAADHHPAVPAGVAGLAAEASRGHAAAARRSPRSSRRSCAGRRS